jgi:lantibiotic biosynthesis protein
MLRKWRKDEHDHLLTGAAAEDAVRAISDIAEALAPSSTPAVGDRAPGIRAPGPSFAGGHAGIALFYAYLAAAWEGPQAARQAWSSLECAVEELSQGQSSGVGFFTGMSGIAWTCHHLHRLLAGEASAETTAEVDAALIEVVNQRPWRWEYDLIYGLAGIGCYALDHPDRRLAASLLDSILARLEELATVTPDGVTWLTPAHFLPPALVANYPAGWYNLGVAHGVPGVIGLLARMAEAGFGGDRARRLLIQAVRWLLSQQRILDGGSRFPTHLSPTGTGPSSRSAWCYGDPGVAAVLWRAARAAGRPTWAEHALTLAQRDIRRPRRGWSTPGSAMVLLASGTSTTGSTRRRVSSVLLSRRAPGSSRPWRCVSPGHERPGHERPGHERPGHERPGHERPGTALLGSPATGRSSANGTVIPACSMVWRASAWLSSPR